MPTSPGKGGVKSVPGSALGWKWMPPSDSKRNACALSSKKIFEGENNENGNRCNIRARRLRGPSHSTEIHMQIKSVHPMGIVIPAPPAGQGTARSGGARVGGLCGRGGGDSEKRRKNEKKRRTEKVGSFRFFGGTEMRAFRMFIFGGRL